MLTTMALAASVLASSPTATQITVYNLGFALVKEQRTLNLTRGVQSVAIEDVAQMIEANSVSIRSLSAPGSFTVLEQNYQYDLINSWAILNKAVGHRIVFNRVLPDGQKERIVGTLLSAPIANVSDPSGNQTMTWNGMVVRTDDGRILLNPSGEIEVSSIPPGMISKPTLLWELESSEAGENKVELSYLTKGVSWTADYVLSMDGDGKLGDLKGWVTMNNNSGTAFENAQLKLLAGDVRRVMPQFRAPGGAGGREPMAAESGFQQEQFADYHLYTLQRPASIRNNEIKQLSLLEGFRVPITKKLLIDFGRFGVGTPGEGTVGSGPVKPTILIQFTNDEASQLGMPMPGGTVKVFQRDSGGSLQLLGEDQIRHTPRNERLSLTVGEAFDVVAERKRTEFEWLTGAGQRGRGARETFEIEVRNRKETPETVYLLERPWGSDWRITQQSMPWEKLDSNTVQFKVELAANEVKTVRYTLETYWPR